MRHSTTTLLLAIAVRGATVLLAASALEASATASAQDAPTAGTTGQPLLDTRLASVRARLLAAAQRASADGLPRQWIEAKVLEGLAKHVQPERIAAAAELLADRMHLATTLARTTPAAGRTEVARAALEALAVGARGEALALLVTEVAHDSRNASVDARTALRTVAELGERGFDAALATQSARTAWRNGRGEGLHALLEVARRIPRSEARARGDELTREAAAPHARNTERTRERNDAINGERPAEHGGPPRDDSFTNGASHGRALGRTGG